MVRPEMKENAMSTEKSSHSDELKKVKEAAAASQATQQSSPSSANVKVSPEESYIIQRCNLFEKNSHECINNISEILTIEQYETSNPAVKAAITHMINVTVVALDKIDVSTINNDIKTLSSLEEYFSRIVTLPGFEAYQGKHTEIKTQLDKLRAQEAAKVDTPKVKEETSVNTVNDQAKAQLHAEIALFRKRLQFSGTYSQYIPQIATTISWEKIKNAEKIVQKEGPIDKTVYENLRSLNEKLQARIETALKNSTTVELKEDNSTVMQMYEDSKVLVLNSSKVPEEIAKNKNDAQTTSAPATLPEQKNTAQPSRLRRNALSSRLGVSQTQEVSQPKVPLWNPKSPSKLPKNELSMAFDELAKQVTSSYVQNQQERIKNIKEAIMDLMISTTKLQEADPQMRSKRQSEFQTKKQDIIVKIKSAPLDSRQKNTLRQEFEQKIKTLEEEAIKEIKETISVFMDSMKKPQEVDSKIKLEKQTDMIQRKDERKVAMHNIIVKIASAPLEKVQKNTLLQEFQKKIKTYNEQLRKVQTKVPSAEISKLPPAATKTAGAEKPEKDSTRPSIGMRSGG
jgi:hypothetical protein